MTSIPVAARPRLSEAFVTRTWPVRDPSNIFVGPFRSAIMNGLFVRASTRARGAATVELDRLQHSAARTNALEHRWLSGTSVLFTSRP